MENKRVLNSKVIQNERSVPDNVAIPDDKLSSARVGFNALFEISQLLDTGLDRETLMYCTRLCQNGLDPEGLAHIISDMKMQVEEFRLKQDERWKHTEVTDKKFKR